MTINGSTATLDMAGNSGTVLAVTLDGVVRSPVPAAQKPRRRIDVVSLIR